jgi:peptidyl-prolyl cis-trans isomerase C
MNPLMEKEKKERLFLGVRTLQALLSYALGLLFFLPACGIFSHPEERVVITVGSQKITVSELKRDIRQFISGMGIGNRKLGSAADPIINKILEKYLILQYGKEKGITIPETELQSAIKGIRGDYPGGEFKEMLLNRYVDLQDWKEGMRQHLLIKKIAMKASEAISPVTSQEAKQYYESHREEFVHPEMVQFRQIITLKREEAEAAIQRLRKGEDLGQVARQYSITPEADRGGLIGWVAKGELEESMEKVVFALSPGKVSPIIETAYGYHLFEVLAKKPEGYQSLPEVMKQIETKLFDQKKELFYEKWITELRKSYPVWVNREILATLELG